MSKTSRKTKRRKQSMPSSIRIRPDAPLIIFATVMILAAISLFFVMGCAIRAHFAEQKLAQAATQLQEMSNHNSGGTFAEVVETLQSDMPEYEIIIVFDKNGQKLIEYTEEHRHGVALPDEALELLRKFKGLTHAHNHPFIDCGHSDGDLHMLSRTGLDQSVDELVVIGKEHTYHLNHNQQAWPTVDQVFQYTTILYNHYGPLEEAGFMGTAFAEGEQRAFFTNRFLQAFADDLGYQFSVVSA